MKKIIAYTIVLTMLVMAVHTFAAEVEVIPNATQPSAPPAIKIDAGPTIEGDWSPENTKKFLMWLFGALAGLVGAYYGLKAMHQSKVNTARIDNMQNPGTGSTNDPNKP